MAAIITLPDGRYLLQLRDDLPQIWHPAHWGLFGGGIDPGEDALAALRRELCEELEFAAAEATFFTRFDYDLGGMGLGRFHRTYFVVRMTDVQLGAVVLHEGSAYRAMTGEEALSLQMSPYDAFALFLHFRRDRIG